MQHLKKYELNHTPNISNNNPDNILIIYNILTIFMFSLVFLFDLNNTSRATPLFAKSPDMVDESGKIFAT